MTDNNGKETSKKKLGDYLLVSSGTINNAVEKQIDAYTRGEPIKPIGELLIESGIITQEELENSIRNQRIARLGSCPVFASLNQTDLATLSKQFTEIAVTPGEQFITKGEDDPTLYIIATGLVEVYDVDNAGNEVVIARVGEGEPIGEMGYFSGGIRTAYVKAIEPTQLLRADYEDLTDYFENVPRVALAFTEVVDHRRQELQRRMQEQNNS